MKSILWIGVLFLIGRSAFSQPITVKDVLGRTVTLKQPATKVLLGEGRDMVTLNILDANPVSLVAAWQDDFKKTLEYNHYRKKFPEIEKIAVVGSNASTFSAEKAIIARPDIAIFSANGHGPGPQSKELIAQLEAAGIPVLFIDFRKDPFNNTVPSIRILGKILNREKRAEAFIRFYETRKNRIADRIKENNPKRPKVFMDMKAGMAENEFNSPGKSNLGSFIAMAGGHNIGADVLPGAVGQLNQEFVISADPDIYIATGTDIFRGRGVVLGADVKPAEVIASMKKRLAHPIVAELSAVKNKRVYGLWHLFYASPFNILAAECIAKWTHPALFADINPDASLKELNNQFLSTPLSGVYWISLDK
ncbi:MAG TPA: ABC transporter substrate-binding protein [Flavitalea sp.]|nr:ABC transporter substrate-binding protein [Flavitalea sp.]